MKILIIKTSSLGDVVHTLPALTDAKNMLPNASFDWVVEEAFAEIPSWHQAVEKVIPIALRRWRKNITKNLFNGEIKSFLTKLREDRYDYIIDAQGLIKSAVIARLARGFRYGYDSESAREPVASWFYHNKIGVSKDLHAITRIRELFAAALHYPMPTTAPDYGINVNAFPQAKEEEKYVVFFHGTSRAEKCWNETKWLELTRLATDAGYIVYLPWGNNLEQERAKRIATVSPAAKVLPKLNLTTIATLLLSAQGAVAVDTGLGHIAAALSVPTISLYGPTDIKLIGTVGNNQVHLDNLAERAAIEVWQKLTEIM